MAKAKAKKTEPDATAAFLAAQAPDDLLAPKEPDLNNLERHPLSEKYGPPLTDEEMLGLASDIEANGQHETIKLFEGKVLAGWNRYRACRQKGIVPRVENYEGDKPEAVAFGTNVIRRRLSSINKAYLGALFYISTGGKQVDIAKQCSVSLNRLNQCVQLLKLEGEEADRVRGVLATNPEVTGSNFDEMLLECGIARSNPKTASNVRPIRDGVPLDGEPDDLEDLDDDLTGGAIDGLEDMDEDPDDQGDEAPRKPRNPVGDGADPLPAVGGKGPSMKNAHETIVSRLAKAFKGLSAAEQLDFAVFTWGKLQPALNAAIAKGSITYAPPEAPAKPEKAKGAAYVAARKAAKATDTPPAPEKPAKAAKTAPPEAPAKPTKATAPAKPAKPRKAA